jgi:hypothetical protein
MLYKPKFCCNCGEKIQRAEWNLLTSRRFCEVCSAENKKHDLLFRGVVGVGILATVFGFGTFVGGNESKARPENFVREQSSEARPETLKQSRNDSVTEQNPRQLNQAETATQAAPYQAEQPADQRFALKRDSSTGTAYYCGARTKKGTPCSRRIKIQGAKCWQHEGKTDSLPEN